MYIELFVLDNFLMDFLIIQLASAISRLNRSMLCTLAVCAVLAIASVFSLNLAFLQGLVAKLILGIVASIPFFVSYKRVFMLPIFSVFLSAMLLGGITFAFSTSQVGVLHTWTRLLLYPAAIASILPGVLRHVRAKHCVQDLEVTIEIVHNGNHFCMNGIIDSGNTLKEPISGLPVALVYAPALEQFASIPLVCSSISATDELVFAFHPTCVLINKTPVDILVAPIDNASIPALIPAAALRSSAV